MCQDYKSLILLTYGDNKSVNNLVSQVIHLGLTHKRIKSIIET